MLHLGFCFYAPFPLVYGASHKSVTSLSILPQAAFILSDGYGFQSAKLRTVAEGAEG